MVGTNETYRGAGIYGAGTKLDILAYKPASQTLYTYGGRVSQIGESIGTHYFATGTSTSVPTRDTTAKNPTTLYRKGSALNFWPVSSGYYRIGSGASNGEYTNKYLRGNLALASKRVYFDTTGSGSEYKSVKALNGGDVYYSSTASSDHGWIKSLGFTEMHRYTTGDAQSYNVVGNEVQAVVSDDPLYASAGYTSLPQYERDSDMAFRAGAQVTVASSTTKQYYERDEASDTSVMQAGQRLGLNTATGTVTEVTVVK